MDFVCNLGSVRYYIQSAYSLPNEEKAARELRPLSKIDDSFRKVVITRDLIPAHFNENGILTLNIFDFLLDKSSLSR